jgi:hypothetical protein
VPGGRLRHDVQLQPPRDPPRHRLQRRACGDLGLRHAQHHAGVTWAQSSRHVSEVFEIDRKKKEQKEKEKNRKKKKKKREREESQKER